MFNKYRVSNPNPQRGGGNGSSLPACQKCSESHLRKCLDGMDGCVYDKSGHNMKGFPLLLLR